MSIEEIERKSNLKWLWRRHVADAATRQEAVRKAARTALQKFNTFIRAFDELDMLDDLWYDGSHMRLSPQSKEKWRRVRVQLSMIENLIKRYLP